MGPAGTSAGLGLPPRLPILGCEGWGCQGTTTLHSPFPAHSLPAPAQQVPCVDGHAPPGSPLLPLSSTTQGVKVFHQGVLGPGEPPSPLSLRLCPLLLGGRRWRPRWWSSSTGGALWSGSRAGLPARRTDHFLLGVEPSPRTCAGLEQNTCWRPGPLSIQYRAPDSFFPLSTPPSPLAQRPLSPDAHARLRAAGAPGGARRSPERCAPAKTLASSHII